MLEVSIVNFRRAISNVQDKERRKLIRKKKNSILSSIAGLIFCVDFGSNARVTRHLHVSPWLADLHIEAVRHEL